jgi:2-keto-4-pentenoate hydratase
MADASRIAAALMEGHRKGEPFRSFAAPAGITTLAAAYLTQREYVRLQMRDRNVDAAGYKVGLTSPRMQAMCSIDRPIAGVVLQDTIHKSGAELVAGDYGRLGLEFEIAVRLGHDLDGARGPITLKDAIDAVDSVCAAVEIVDDRNCDYSTLDVLSLIADNSWNAGIVLGEFTQNWPPLDTGRGAVTVNGQAADSGLGQDVLGHPINALAWLASHLGETGQKTPAGAIVMTGSLVTTKFPTESCAYRFDLSGIGAVEVSIRV